MNCGKPNVQPPQYDRYDLTLPAIQKTQGIYKPEGYADFRIITVQNMGQFASFVLQTEKTVNVVIPLDVADWKGMKFKAMSEEKLFIGIGPAT